MAHLRSLLHCDLLPVLTGTEASNQKHNGDLKKVFIWQLLPTRFDVNSKTHCMHILYVKECRDMTRKAKAHFELNLVRGLKDNKKGFFKYANNKRKTKENVTNC